MQRSQWYTLALALTMVVSYSLLYIFPIAAFPTTFSKTVYAFHLPSEHKLITYPEYYEYVWASAALLPVMAVALATVKHDVAKYLLFLVSSLIFLIVAPQAFSFSTDAKPLGFDTRPSWSVYMAMYGPIFVLMIIDADKVRNVN